MDLIRVNSNERVQNYINFIHKKKIDALLKS